MYRQPPEDRHYARVLTVDDERQVRSETCRDCGRNYQRIVGFVYRDGDAHAIFRAELHGHDDDREAWIDVTLDSDWEDPSEAGRVTIGWRVGRFGNNAEPAASLVQSGVAYPDATTFGQRLSRDQALQHPNLGDFWEVVGFLLTNDPDLVHHVYHRP